VPGIVSVVANLVSLGKWTKFCGAAYLRKMPDRSTFQPKATTGCQESLVGAGLYGRYSDLLALYIAELFGEDCTVNGLEGLVGPGKGHAGHRRYGIFEDPAAGRDTGNY